jgi:CPA2 family monovalent cation:H+ antiporter-2
MALTPLLMNLSGPLANLMLKLPLPDFLVKGMFPLPEVEIPGLQNHLVIIGRDPSSLKMAVMAKHYNIPRVSLIFDPVVAKEKMKEGEYVVYGDAVHEPILTKAHVDKAGIVVISIGNIITAMAVTEKVRKINSSAHIIVRTIQISDMEHLYQLGANQVFPEKLEIAINLFNRVLLNMLYPQKQINRMIAHIRSMNLGEFVKNDLLNQPSAVDELPNFNITALAVDKDSRAIGNSLVDLDLRKKTGATILAIKRGGI